MSVLADTIEVTEVLSLHARIGKLVAETERMLALTSEGRTIFTATEVMDFALDCRTALLEANEMVPA